MEYQTLKTLCGLPGVSGAEEPVRYEILKQIEGHCIYRVDPLGNILAFKKGRREPAQLMLFSAHMDEVGLIVTYIEESGLLRFAPVGGIDRRVLPGKAVKIGGIPGVIGSKAVHLKSAEEKDKAPALDALYIDIGACSREEAEEKVALGDRAVFCAHDCEMGDGFLRARALDDRLGCALLIEMLHGELEYDAHFAFTVQEETGATGAKTAAAQIGAKIGIAVETTTACDLPDVPPEKTVCALKKGPVLSFMDRGTVYDLALYRQALETAQEQGIPCQPKAGIYGGNESRSVQAAGNGARVLAVSVPCRYLHTPSCVAHRSDVENTLALLQALNGAFGG